MNILLRKTFRDLRSSMAQTGALVFIVALGIASFIALVGAYRDLSTSYNSTYDRLKFADVTFSVQSAPENAAASVAQVPGVQSSTGRLVVDTGFQLSSGEQIRARLIGLPPGQHPSVNDILVTQGSYLAADDTRTALVEKHFADIYGIQPGGTVSPIINGQKIDFTVAGVAASPEYLIVTPSRQDILPSASTFAVLFVPLPELQQLQTHTQTQEQEGQESGAINDIAVRYSPGADRQKVQNDVQATLAPYGVTAVTPRSAQPSNEALSLDLDGYRELSILMPALILIVSAISMYAMLGRTVRAQQPQIGLLKALGYSNGAVVAHYLTFGLLIALAGALIGTPGGLLLSNVVTSEYAGELGIPLVESRIYPDLVLIGLGLSLLFSLLACAGPARAAVRLAPADAMRMDPALALVSGRVSWLERMLRGLHPSIWLRLPLRNVFRVRGRSLSTGLGILLAFMLILMSWGMFDSMSYLLSHNFEDVERWDVSATFNESQQQPILDHVRGWAGVKQIEPIIQLPASLQANGQSVDAFVTAFDPAQKMHALQISEGTTPEEALSGNRIVLTPGLAGKLHLSAGDTLRVSTPMGNADFTLGGTSEELSGSAAFVSLNAALNLASMSTGGAGSEVSSRPVFNGLYLTVDSAQAHAIKAELYNLPGVASVKLKSEVESDWQSLMGLFYAFMGAVLAFAVAMAFALLFNAMTVNVLERRREFATMRAMGMGGGNITWQLTLENVFMWLAALIPGILLGSWVASQMGAAFSSDLIQFKIVIAPLSYVLASVGILLTMELAALPAIRRVNRLNLAEATKALA
ncbi:MAG: FtsX-like permease family protein [Chloroflexota bacterium]